MQHYFIKQFAEHACSAPGDSSYTTGTMTSTRTIEGGDQDKSFSEIKICPDMLQKKHIATATGTFTDSVESIDQDANRRSDFF